MAEHTCATCAYGCNWDSTKPHGNDKGECRRYPPERYSMQQPAAAWPIIRGNHWCGEHSALQTGESVARAACSDCGLLYSDERFCDLVLPDNIWREISPDGEGNGLLCPNCIAGRLARGGHKGVSAKFTSGPLAARPTPPPPEQAEPAGPA